MAHPRQFRIPNWMLNRQKDVKDGKFSQVFANALDSKLRDDIERLKKIRAHRGLRHYWGLRVRGQHTKTTGKFFPRCFLIFGMIFYSLFMFDRMKVLSYDQDIIFFSFVSLLPSSLYISFLSFLMLFNISLSFL